jgi:hypothetical protein
MDDNIQALDEISKITSRIQRIDGYIRNGQFVSANREARSILAEIKKEEGYGGQKIRAEIKMHMKRLVGFLAPVVSAHSEAEKLFDMLKREREVVLERSEDRTD